MRNQISTIVLLLFGVLWGMPSMNYAQNPFKNGMEEAKAHFDAGRFEASIAELNQILIRDAHKPGHKDHFHINRGEKWEVYRLLTLNYFYMKQMEAADSLLEKMILMDPDYRPREDFEPSDFMHYFNSHKVVPFGLGAKIGSSLSFVDTLKGHSVNGSPSNFESARDYIPTLGVNVSLILDVYLSRRIWLTLEPSYSLRRYKYQDRSFSVSLTDFEESLHYVELPLSIKWEALRYGNSPFLRVGGSPGFLLGSRASITNSSEDDPFTGSLLQQRNRLALNPFIGAGVNLEWGSGKFTIEARHQWGLVNVVNRDTRWDDELLIFNYFHLDDDFLLRSLVLSVAYTHIFQSIKKINR